MVRPPLRVPLWLAVLPGLAGCFDYMLKPRDTGTSPYSWEDTDGGPAIPDASAPCMAWTELPTTSGIDESCQADPETGTLYATVEWSVAGWTDSQEYGDILMAPVVGQLNDDDGDGEIDADDTPDIVVITDDDGDDNPNTRGVMRFLRGSDGFEEARAASGQLGELQVFPYRYTNLALGDVTLDGLPDVVGVAEVVGGDPTDDTGGGTPDTGKGGGGGDDTGGDVVVHPPPPEGDGKTICAVAAWTASGDPIWVSSVTVDCAGHAPALADLEGDGVPEVLLGAMALDGPTGELLWLGDSGGEARFEAYSQVGEQSFAMDMDGDGVQEVLAGRVVYDAAGVKKCEIDEGLDDGFPAAADFDLDGAGEFVLVGNGRAHVHDGDCTLLAEWALVGSGNGGPPTVADFDADGTPEIGIAEAQTYSVYEADGTVRWSNPTTDASSHATGSSVFDFDGDGRAEVVYADEVTLWVYDGVTGQVRLRDAGHTSRTLHEYPVIVDVDGDGMVEIVVPQGGGHHGIENVGIYVLGSADRSWMGDREVWNQHAYSITNINDDLSIPAPARPNWPEYNTFRSGDLGLLTGGSLPDAVPYATVCENPCSGGMIEIQVRIGNGAPGAMRAGVPVSLYTMDGDTLRWLASTETPDVLRAGENSAVLSFTVPAHSIIDGIAIVRADDAHGTAVVSECHEDNNQARLDGVVCE